MSSEETSYDFSPITHTTPVIPNNKIVSDPGTLTHKSHTKIDNLNHQAQENSRYDTISETSVQPMYGGHINIYNVLYKKKDYIIHAGSIEKSIQIFLKNKNITQDEIIEIYEEQNIKNKKNNKNNKNNKKIKNTYLLRNMKNKKIKVIKIH
jgi:hypothetical protein